MVYRLAPDAATGDWLLGVALNDEHGGFHDIVPTTVPGYSAIVFEDVNGDDKADAIAVTTGFGAVNVWQSLGDGTFALGPPAASLPTCDHATDRRVAIGDLTGDSTVDVVVADTCIDPTSTLRVTIGVGDGQGGFKPTTAIETDGNVARSLLIRDLDRDERPEVLVAGRETIIFRNKGEGQLDTPTRQPLGTNLQVADLDGDGLPDLIGQGNGLLVAFNQGDTTFAAPTVVAPCLYSLAVGDLNADGRPDLACEMPPSSVQVLMNLGHGRFDAAIPLAGDGLPTQVGDWDHDGDADLIANLGTVVFFNDGGMLPSRAARQLYPTADAARVADLNGDGALDFITVDRVRCKVVLARADRTFGEELPLPSCPYAGVPGVGDISGDGKPDLVFAYLDSEGRLGVAVNDGMGRFSAPTFVTAGPYPAAAAVVDLNRDGKADVVARVAGGVAVLLNDGAGNLKAPVAHSLGDVRAMETGDLDGNGVPDVVVAGPRDIWVLLGPGDGTLAAPVRYGPGGTQLALLDINRDHRPEIAIAAVTEVAVLLNAGDATFGAAIPIGGPRLVSPDSTSPPPRALLAGQLNGDQAVDLVAVYDTTVWTLFTDGTGGIRRDSVFSLRPSASALAFGDLNEDGQTDLVIARP